jgi:hypothetical protein
MRSLAAESCTRIFRIISPRRLPPLPLGFEHHAEDIQFVISVLASGKDLYLPDLDQFLDNPAESTTSPLPFSPFDDITPFLYLLSAFTMFCTFLFA